MFGRKKSHGSAAETGPPTVGMPGREESLRVLQSFLSEQPAGPDPGFAGTSAGFAPAPSSPGFTPAPPPPAFTPAPPPAGFTPAPPPSAFTPAPPPPGFAPTPPAGKPPGWGPNPAAFNITPLVGSESTQPAPPLGAGNVSVPVPGVGPVSNQQLEEVLERVNQVLRRISGGADLSQKWTADQVRTALPGLESVHAEGGVTQEQYESLKAALVSMLTQ